MKAEDWILLSFPAANRDPAQFDRAAEVVIDREVNRHAAFGLGIHRCLGSHLARMELRIALEVWLERIPAFTLADPGAVTWSAGPDPRAANAAHPDRLTPIRLSNVPRDSGLIVRANANLRSERSQGRLHMFRVVRTVTAVVSLAVGLASCSAVGGGVDALAPATSVATWAPSPPASP